MASRTTEQERPLHILTVNVNELKTNGNKLLEELENNEVDVVFLTKTNIGEKKTDRDALENYEDGWKIFFTRYNSQSKGAAVLVNKKRDFKCLDEIVDGLGRYVIVNCCISGTLCTFVSVYHHSKEKRLLRKLSQKIKLLDTDILVVGGDFNTVLDEEKDRTSILINSVHNRIREELKPFMKEHKLIDAWREIHPNDREYTYGYRDPKTNDVLHSRLDYFFINADKWELVQDCIINKDKISNHRSVSLFLDLNDQTQELRIFSSTVHDLPKDKVLAKLRPDIILLAKGQAEHKDYIKKLEKERHEKWKVLWSEHSNAAILVKETQNDIDILFVAYHQNYVILHCKVLDMPLIFVSACHSTDIQSNLKNMLREMAHSQSGEKVIAGNCNTSDEIITEMKKNGLNLKDKSIYFIHATLERASEIRKIEQLDLLILHLSQDEDQENDNDFSHFLE